MQQQKLASPAAASALQTNLDTFETLLQRSAVERQQAELILSYETGTPLETMRSEMAPLNAKGVQLNRQLMAQREGLRTRRVAGEK